MIKSPIINQLIEQLANQIDGLVNNSIAQDLRKNTKAIITSVFDKLDLVTREEFEVQQKVLIATRLKLEELERKLAEL